MTNYMLVCVYMHINTHIDTRTHNKNMRPAGTVPLRILQAVSTWVLEYSKLTIYSINIISETLTG
jgi:hypothetical protein